MITMTMESRLTLFTRCGYCILGADTAIPCVATAISCADNVLSLRLVHPVWITVHSNILTVWCAARADAEILCAALDRTCADNDVPVLMHKFVFLISLS